MITSVTLGPGVELHPDHGHLVDAVRDQSVNLNQSATYMLHSLGRNDLDRSAAEISTRLGVDRNIVQSDLEALCRRLNSRALVNLQGYQRRLLRDWLRDAQAMLRRGIFPGWPPITVTRRSIDTSTPQATALTLLRSGLRSAIAWTFMMTVGLLITFVPITGLSIEMAELAIASLVGTSIGISILLHELGHALFLRRVPTVLITRGLRLFLIHRPVSARRAVWVAAAGPAVAGVSGMALVAIAHLLGSLLLAPLALALAFQPLGLTVAAHDGRHVLGYRTATSPWLVARP